MADTDNKDLDKQIEGMEKLQKAAHSAAETIKGISAGTLQKSCPGSLKRKGRCRYDIRGDEGFIRGSRKREIKNYFL